MERMVSAVLPMSPKIAVLFVCMGNICRSPVLMAILRKKAEEKNLSDRISVDSCAISGWFLGDPVDPRMVAAAEGRGLILDHSARLLDDSDFSAFDLILAVDREVLRALQAHAREQKYKGKVALATAYSKRFKDQDIIDPYYGGPEQFKKTIEIAEDCCEGIINQMTARPPDKA